MNPIGRSYNNIPVRFGKTTSDSPLNNHKEELDMPVAETFAAGGTAATVKYVKSTSSFIKQNGNVAKTFGQKMAVRMESIAHVVEQTASAMVKKMSTKGFILRNLAKVVESPITKGAAKGVLGVGAFALVATDVIKMITGLDKLIKGEM